MRAPILTHRVAGPENDDPPVVLLNGGFMTLLSWGAFGEAIEARHRTIRCDFRGQLLTPGPAHRSLAPNVDDLVDLLDALGVERAHLVGTSFGGLVGLLSAARRPDRVASLVAITVADRATPAMTRSAEALRKVVGEVLAGGDRGRFHDALVDEIYAPEYVETNRELLATRRGQIAGLPEAWFAALDDLLAAVEHFDLRADLAEIRRPTLVVLATGDRVMPVAGGRAVAAALAGARCLEHPTSGHTLVIEDPAWLAARTLEFLEEVSP